MTPRISLDQTDQERLQRAVKNVLQSRIGIENAITGKELTKWLKMTGWDNFSFERLHRAVRVTITTLRQEYAEPICSQGGVGYWWPMDPEEGQIFVRETLSRIEDLKLSLAGYQRGLSREFGIPEAQMELF